MTEDLSADLSNFVYENPEVSALIQDLGLVPFGSPAHLEHLAACRRSRYYRYHFCDRYKDLLKSKVERRSIVAREMYLSYRKNSRYTPSPDISVSAPLKLF